MIGLPGEGRRGPLLDGRIAIRGEADASETLQSERLG